MIRARDYFRQGVGMAVDRRTGFPSVSEERTVNFNLQPDAWLHQPQQTK